MTRSGLRGPCPPADAGQVSQGDAASGASSLGHDALADAMIHAGGEQGFFPCPLRRSRSRTSCPSPEACGAGAGRLCRCRFRYFPECGSRHRWWRCSRCPGRRQRNRPSFGEITLGDVARWRTGTICRRGAPGPTRRSGTRGVARTGHRSSGTVSPPGARPWSRSTQVRRSSCQDRHRSSNGCAASGRNVMGLDSAFTRRFEPGSPRFPARMFTHRVAYAPETFRATWIAGCADKPMAFRSP